MRSLSEEFQTSPLPARRIRRFRAKRTRLSWPPARPGYLGPCPRRPRASCEWRPVCRHVAGLPLPVTPSAGRPPFAVRLCSTAMIPCDHLYWENTTGRVSRKGTKPQRFHSSSLLCAFAPLRELISLLRLRVILIAKCKVRCTKSHSWQRLSCACDFGHSLENQ